MPDESERKSSPTCDKTCFVVSPIGAEKSDIRRRADQVLKYIIRPVARAEPFGYHVVRADDIADPGLITSQVFRHLLEDQLVVADLTGHNPNVFYELAIRHAVAKPVVQMIATGQALPFNVNASRTILFDINDLDSVENAKQELRKQIAATEASDFRTDSPLGHALQVSQLEGDADPQVRAAGAILDRLDLIESRIHRMTMQLPFLYDSVDILTPARSSRRQRSRVASSLYPRAKPQSLVRIATRERLRHLDGAALELGPFVLELCERLGAEGFDWEASHPEVIRGIVEGVLAKQDAPKTA